MDLHRSFHYVIGYRRPTGRQLKALATITVKPYNNLHQFANTANPVNCLAYNVKSRIVGTSIVHVSDLEWIDELEEDSRSKCNVTAKVLT